MCLTLLRVLLAGWVGAAALFVVVGVREVTSQEFDSATRDALVLLRFPAYYVYGACSLGASWLCCLGARAGNLDRRFVAYHQASKWINAAGVGLCLAGALLVSWPRSGSPAAGA